MSCLRRRTDLCKDLASEPTQPINSGTVFKLDSLSDRIAAESARTTARTVPGPGRLASGRLTNVLRYVPNAQRRPPSSDDKRTADDAAGPTPRLPRMPADEKATAKRKREDLAQEASTREYQRRRHNFHVQLNNGRRAAVAPPPTAGVPTTGDESETTDLQRASIDVLSALTPTKADELQSEISRRAGAEVDEDDFFDSLAPPRDSKMTGQPP